MGLSVERYARPCNHIAMVALSSETPDTPSQTKDLRWKIGAAVAAAWLLTQLWIASPFPYMLKGATGLDLVANSAQERGLSFGFALCLAFILFPPRWLKLPWTADAVLAAVAAISGSITAWNYGHLSLNPAHPGTFSLAVAFIGTVMLALAALRVFGRLGAIIVAFFLLIHLLPYTQQWATHGFVTGLEGWLNRTWLSEYLSIFGFPVGFVVSFGFMIVVLGCGYDLFGYGRLLARSVLRTLPRETPAAELANNNPVARRLLALTALFYFLSGDLFGWFATAERLGLNDVSSPLVFGLFVYCVSLMVAWSSNWTSDAHRRWRLVSVGAGGMLIGFAAILNVGPIIVHAAFKGAFDGLSIRLPGFPGSMVALVLFAVIALLLIAVVSRQDDPKRRRLWFGGPALLPLLLLFWSVAVDRLSPGLAGFYAVFLMLIVMAGSAYSGVGREDGSRGVGIKDFAAQYFLPLSHGVARVMVRVMIATVALGIVLPWVPALVALIEYLRVS